MPQILGKKIGPVGYGLMGTYISVKTSYKYVHYLITMTGLTWRPTPPSEEQSFKAMRAALANGCNFVSEPSE
jgi:pyridoxine 4-dehydrogenase